jgi:hypothetical protein
MGNLLYHFGTRTLILSGILWGSMMTERLSQQARNPIHHKLSVKMD